MAIITEVRFAHEDGALADTLGRLPTLDVAVIGETSTVPDGSISLLRFEYDGPEDLAAVLAADHTVSETVERRVTDGGYLLDVAFADGAKLMSPRVTSQGGFVLDARSDPADADPRGWRERWLLPDREALHDVWQYAREEGFEFEVRELHQRGRTDAEYPGPDAVTEEQRQALVAAYERGYFAEPRDSSLEELAETLDISPSAVGGRLKRGLKSLVGAALVVDDREERDA